MSARGSPGSDAIRLNNMFRGVEPTEMLRVLLNENMLGDVAAVSSFGAESAVLLHLIAQASPSTPVLFLDTGKHFPETLAYRDLVERLGLTDLRILTPDPETIEEGRDRAALVLRSRRLLRDPQGRAAGKGACRLRRVDHRPQGFQSSTRSRPAALRARWRPAEGQSAGQLDQGRSRRLFRGARPAAPSAGSRGLSLDRLRALHQQGSAGEDPRAGRWRGWDKTECGIHVPVADPDDPANQPVF
jgi:phosphoadenosine phosphosulfate reductase